MQKQCVVTGQGLPLCLHCVLFVIQSHHLHFTRSETLSWPTTGGHCLSLCVCALTYFHFVLLCCVLWACALAPCVCMHVRPGSLWGLLDACDSPFADCLQMVRISQSNVFTLNQYTSYLHNSANQYNPLIDPDILSAFFFALVACLTHSKGFHTWCLLEYLHCVLYLCVHTLLHKRHNSPMISSPAHKPCLSFCICRCVHIFMPLAGQSCGPSPLCPLC